MFVRCKDTLIYDEADRESQRDFPDDIKVRFNPKGSLQILFVKKLIIQNLKRVVYTE